jgi:NADPH-dependent 7-cyano-7-deazaguanine reductase QueF
MLSIKNLKQKRFNKKMLHKYVESFRIKNKSKTQIYRLILFNIYRIYNTFYVSLLKLYLHRVDNK